MVFPVFEPLILKLRILHALHNIKNSSVEFLDLKITGVANEIILLGLIKAEIHGVGNYPLAVMCKFEISLASKPLENKLCGRMQSNLSNADTHRTERFVRNS